MNNISIADILELPVQERICLIEFAQVVEK